jgi:Na+-translocating ferredoxin:NAD+ oxidoreductase RnfG subunit
MSPLLDSFPSALSKKLNKLIAKTWEVESPIVENVSIDFENHMTTNEFNLFKVSKNDIQIGYVYLSKAKGRFDYFDYAILFNPNLEIDNVTVLVYRSDYGGEIASKNWLKQFLGMKNEQKQYGKDINAISGATLSGNSLTKGINEACEIINKLKEDSKLILE